MIGFYLGWWAAAWGASHSFAWIGPVVSVVLVGIHLRLTTDRKAEGIFILSMGLVGFLVETLAIQFGLFQLSSLERLAPLWIVSMWILFALTFEGMLALTMKPILLVLGAAVGGPISYYAGEKMGLITYARPLALSIVLHALLWSALVPLLIWLRRRIYLRF